MDLFVSRDLATKINLSPFSGLEPLQRVVYFVWFAARCANGQTFSTAPLEHDQLAFLLEMVYFLYHDYF